MKYCVITVLLAALSTSLPSMAMQSRTAPLETALEHINLAKKYLAEHDLNRGRAEIELAISIDPTSSEAYSMLGQLDLQTENVSEAISDFRRAVKLKPNSFTAHYGLGMALLRARDAEGGVRELQSAVFLRPHDADANYNLGVKLLDLGRPGEAIAHLRQAQTPGHERADVSYNLIRAELAVKDLDGARREGKIAAKLLETDPNWQAAVGQLFLDSHQPGDAIPYLLRAVALRPDTVEIRRRLATAYLESSQPGEALVLIKNPQAAEDYYLLSSANYTLRHYELAAKYAQTAIQMQLGQPQYMLLAARIDQHLGRHDSALSMLEKIIKIAPNWAEPYYSAGVSLYCEKRYADAQKYLKESLALQPDSSRGLFLYAVSLISEGKDQEGEAYLRKAIALNQRNAHFRYYLGEILMRDNKLSEAQEVYRQAIRIDSNYAPLHYQLGKLLLRLNHPDLAAQETEEAIRYDPSLAEAYYQLIQVYNKLGERDKAAHAAAIFATLKKQYVSDKQKFYESIKKELGLP